MTFIEPFKRMFIPDVTVRRHKKDARFICDNINEWGFVVGLPAFYTPIAGLNFVVARHPDDFTFLIQHQSKDEFWYHKPGGKLTENMDQYFNLNQEFALEMDYLLSLLDIMKNKNKVIVYTRRYYEYDAIKKRRTDKPSPMNQKLWFSSPLEHVDFQDYLQNTMLYKASFKDYSSGKERVEIRFRPHLRRRTIKRMEVVRGRNPEFYVIPIKHKTYGDQYWFEFNKDIFTKKVAEWDLMLNKMVTNIKKIMAQQKSLRDWTVTE